MQGINEWHDIVRVVAFFVSLFCLVRLVIRYRKSHGEWNVKTNDYWFAMLMWSLAGCVFTVQGIVLDRPFTPGFVFMTAAILVSGKGLSRKGSWGSAT